jgi:GNAT superfamily N-acetyltransferase/Mn-dependent DtxR family transcriptional regulator
VARFPQLKRPITRDQVRAELAQVYAAAGFPGAFDLAWPAYMDRRHQRSRRSYAEVRPGPRPAFAFTDRVRWLPARNRWALYAHEVGHVLDPEGSEDDADAAAEDALGIQIDYDRRWPGKGLQALGGAVRRRRNPGRSDIGGCESGTVFGDGFCSPRGELDWEPKARWTKGCAAEVALAIGQDLGYVTAEEVAAETRCSLSSARNYLRELEKMGAVEGSWEMQGLDRTGRRLYVLNERGMDLAAWIKYRQGSTYHASEVDQEVDPLGLESYLGDPGIDPWDWTQDRDWTYSVEVVPPEDPTFDPWLFRAWSPELEGYPIAELVMFESGHAVYDTRSFGKVGPEDYAPVGRLRVHPAFRQSGVATALMESAAAEAEKLGVALGSSDARTPGQAAWWTAQVKKKRAKKIRHRSRKHPEASRYVLSYPPPQSLSLGEVGARQVERESTEEVPFNNPHDHESAQDYVDRMARQMMEEYMNLPPSARAAAGAFAGQPGRRVVLTAREVADTVGMPISTTRRALKALAEGGYIERQGRSGWTLTGEGLHAVGDVRPKPPWAENPPQGSPASIPIPARVIEELSFTQEQSLADGGVQFVKRGKRWSAVGPLGSLRQMVSFAASDYAPESQGGLDVDRKVAAAVRAWVKRVRPRLAQPNPPYSEWWRAEIQPDPEPLPNPCLPCLAPLLLL